MPDIRDWYTGEVLLAYPEAALNTADLRGAPLRYADLRVADLRGARLQGADLRGVLLWNADLRGADLTDALLQFLDGVREQYKPGADLTGAHLWNALYDNETRWPAEFNPRRSGAVHAANAAHRLEPLCPGGARTFVVGDVHGQADKLHRLLARLRAQAQSGDALVFLGDLIDRGPDSRGVIDLVLAQQCGAWPGPVTALKGNHEEMLLYGLDGHPEFARDAWFNYGGREMLNSYAPDGWPADAWQSVLPSAHVAFLRSLKSLHRDRQGIYMHAGLQPARSPEETDEHARLWIRQEFYASEARWKQVVVFGHTPMAGPPASPSSPSAWRPLNRPEKIGLDTGAGHGGYLTAVVLPERAFVFEA